MLPSPLLRARKRGSLLVILFATGRRREIGVASRLIDLFKSSIGGSLAELNSMLDDLEKVYEAVGVDYRFFRGLSTLLLRKLHISRGGSKVDPVKARLTVYSVVNRLFGGFLPSEDFRIDVYREASRELGVGVSELRESVYSDSDEAAIIERFEEVNAESLLKEYNLSLLQTALFKAASMTVETSSAGWEIKLLLRSIKYRGLMYTAYRTDRGIRIIIDGPSSIIKMTTRYGTAMAKVVPTIISLSSWRVRASIVKKVSNRREYLTLLIDDSKREIFPFLRVEAQPFDSVVEKDFYRIAQQARWKVEREPEPLISKGHIVIPDFKVSRGGTLVYVEIVGFWTPEYLRRKIKKLKGLKEVVVVLADKRLACSSLSKLPSGVVYYEGKLRPTHVYQALSDYMKAKVSVRVDSETVSRIIRREVVDLKILAKESNLDYKSLQDAVKNTKKYIIVEGVAVRKDLALRVYSALKQEECRTYREACRVLSGLGVPEDYYVQVIEAAGYTLIWRGIDIRNALLTRKDVRI